MIIKSFYSKYKNLYPDELNKAFLQACENRKFDEIHYLLTSHELAVHADIHYQSDTALSDACWEGHLDVVQYLLTSTDLKEHASINDYKEQTCYGLLNACGAGHLEIVKYLLTCPDLKEEAIINWQFKPPLSAACEKGYLNIVKYLLTSPDTKEHSEITIGVLLSCMLKNQSETLEYLLTFPKIESSYNIHDYEDSLFKRGVYYQATDCLEYLIFNYNIEITADIKNFLNNPSKYLDKYNEVFVDEIKKMVKKRTMNDELEQELSCDITNNKIRIKL